MIKERLLTTLQTFFLIVIFKIVQKLTLFQKEKIRIQEFIIWHRIELKINEIKNLQKIKYQ